MLHAAIEMAQFSYETLDLQGSIQRGTVVASSEQQALAQLHDKGLMVLRLDSEANALAKVQARRLFNDAQLAGFTQQLATLLSAGQPLERALSSLLKQSKHPARRALVTRLIDRIKSGKPFSQALEEEGNEFSNFYLGLVRAGEAGGALQDTMQQLSEYLERSHKLKGEVINALIYPLFLLVGVVGSVALLLTYVVPQFVPIFRDLGVPIPWITQVILAAGEFLSAYGVWVLIAQVVLVGLAAARRRRDDARLADDRRLLNLAVLGPLFQQLETARFARTLGTLLVNGVALLSALQVVESLSNNRAIRAQVENAAAWVKRGGTLAESFGRKPLLPELALQMIEVGEQSGRLAAMLIKVADIFDAEARRNIDRLLAALVPSLTVVMAVMVAVIMLAIMLPLMSLTSNI